MSDEQVCPIWGTAAEVRPTEGDRNVANSPRAGGRYSITGSAAALVAKRTEDEKRLVTTWIVDQHRLGNEIPEITSDTLDRIVKEKLLGIGDRRNRLLRWFKNQSILLGKQIRIKPGSENSDSLLAWTESFVAEEVNFLLDMCVVGDEILKVFSPNSPEYVHYILSAKGYDHLGSIDRVNYGSEQAFVAMWFDPSMTDPYNKGIDPAVRDAGYRPLRIDQKQHVNRIDDEIIAELRRSRFIVADFTSAPDQPRGGVYFEAGFAYGLGIPVIWTCRQDVFDKVHFDTRQFNHIVWSTAADLFKPLKNRIEAVIGEGPLKNSRFA